MEVKIHGHTSDLKLLWEGSSSSKKIYIRPCHTGGTIAVLINFREFRRNIQLELNDRPLFSNLEGLYTPKWTWKWIKNHNTRDEICRCWTKFLGKLGIPRYSDACHRGLTMHRTLNYFFRGSITVLLTSCLTGLDLTKLVNVYLIQHNQTRWILTSQTLGQQYSDTSPEEVSGCSLNKVSIVI